MFFVSYALGGIFLRVLGENFGLEIFNWELLIFKKIDNSLPVRQTFDDKDHLMP